MDIHSIVLVIVTAVISGGLQTILTVAAVKTDVSWLKKGHDILWSEVSSIKEKIK